MKNVLLILAALTLSVGAQPDKPDVRTRTFVYPKRIVWHSSMKEGGDHHRRCAAEKMELLLAPKHGQVCETYFGQSIGTRLVNDGDPAGVLLDFGH